MNWRRGFGRLWMLCSVAWLALVGIIANDAIYRSGQAVYLYYVEASALPPFKREGIPVYPVLTDKLDASVRTNAPKIDEFTFLHIEEIRERFHQYDPMSDADLSAAHAPDRQSHSSQR